MKPAILSLLLIVANGTPALEDNRSVPAVCHADLKLPGKLNSFKRPGRIINAPPYFESYVADVGNSRIMIFNKKNVFAHEINFQGIISSPLDIAVDTLGFIYALGYLNSTLKIAKMDFDGKFIESFDLVKILGKIKVNIINIYMGENQLIYFIEEIENLVYGMDTKGNIKLSFPIYSPDKILKENEFLYGAIYSKDSLIYIPISNVANFHIYNLKGNFIKSIGVKGTLAGQLNFPVSISVYNEIIYVLDKNRFNVVCFNREGKFLAEFGGKGYNLGWFYYPNSIAINSEGVIFIAQTLNNRIQLCETPPLVIEKNNSREFSTSQN